MCFNEINAYILQTILLSMTSKTHQCKPNGLLLISDFGLHHLLILILIQINLLHNPTHNSQSVQNNYYAPSNPVPSIEEQAGKGQNIHLEPRHSSAQYEVEGI